MAQRLTNVCFIDGGSWGGNGRGSGGRTKSFSVGVRRRRTRPPVIGQGAPRSPKARPTAWRVTLGGGTWADGRSRKACLRCRLRAGPAHLSFPFGSKMFERLVGGGGGGAKKKKISPRGFGGDGRVRDGRRGLGGKAWGERPCCCRIQVHERSRSGQGRGKFHDGPGNDHGWEGGLGSIRWTQVWGRK